MKPPPPPQMLEEARALQERDGKPRYVVRSIVPPEWVIEDRMPLLGEWYTSDGIRHG